MSPKKCVFGCEGKDNLLQLPKVPSVKGRVDAVCFCRAATFFVCLFSEFTFTFMHLADAFIQSDLHCIQVTVLHFLSSCFPWESNP